MKKEKVWKETKKHKEWMNKEISRLKSLFYLQGWEINIYYNRDPKGDASMVAADVTTTWRYRRVELNIYPRFWNEPEEDARACLTHEFVHIVTVQPFELLNAARNGRYISPDEVDDVKEHMTTWLEGIISRANKV